MGAQLIGVKIKSDEIIEVNEDNIVCRGDLNFYFYKDIKLDCIRILGELKDERDSHAVVYMNDNIIHGIEENDKVYKSRHLTSNMFGFILNYEK